MILELITLVVGTAAVIATGIFIVQVVYTELEDIKNNPTPHKFEKWDLVSIKPSVIFYPEYYTKFSSRERAILSKYIGKPIKVTGQGNTDRTFNNKYYWLDIPDSVCRLPEYWIKGEFTK